MLALLVLLGVLWGITFPMVRVGMAAGASPFLLVALDFGLAAAAMFAIAVTTADVAEDPPWGGILRGPCSWEGC
jgi:drug/metabolite transporter (DMT)-like permease